MLQVKLPLLKVKSSLTQTLPSSPSEAKQAVTVWLSATSSFKGAVNNNEGITAPL